MSEALSLLEQADRCRRLAAGLNDPKAAEALRRLAEDLARRAAALAVEPDPIPPPPAAE